MIPKSGYRFSKKIMPKQEISAESDSKQLNQTLADFLGSAHDALFAGIRDRGHEMVELVARAHRLRRHVAAIVRIDRRMQRLAPDDFDAEPAEAVELGGVVGHQIDLRAAEFLQHARRDTVVALVIVET